ncbi:MAG: hypothetical protein ACR2J5_15260 [Geodermatophilaceae bacterium]
MRTLSGLVSGLMAVLAVVSGCATSGNPTDSADRPSDAAAESAQPTAPVATPAVPGMSALAVRLRTDVAVGGQFQTRITNTGSEPFSVVAVSLDSPGFEQLPFGGRPATYQPGATIDLPTPYGSARCGDGSTVDPAYTALQVQRPDGRMEEVRVPLGAPDDILDRIHTEECHLLALTAAVEVTLGGFTLADADGEAILQADITLTRGTSTEEIALTELRGSVVFDVSFAADGDPPPALPAQDSELVVPVVLRMTGRGCDAHVLGETKQPFLFRYFVSFDGGQPQYGVLEVSTAQRDALWSYVEVACADA